MDNWENQVIHSKMSKTSKFGKDSPAYKEARNAVQKECENYKKCFYDRKVAKLKPALGGGGKQSKGLLGCGVPKVGCSKCLKIT